MSYHPQTSQPLFGAVEAGGTKIVCAVAHTPLKPLNIEHFPSDDPESVLKRIVDYFQTAQQEHGELYSIAIGSFGPVDINPDSTSYGSILTTPKKRWEGVNILKEIQSRLSPRIQYTIDTDVNAAALGEYTFGAGRGHKNIAYLTVGTGIGGSFLVDGHAINGRMHPEIGHMNVPSLEPQQSTFSNCCPFHESCIEGWAAGPAIEKRWNQSGSTLPQNHPAWELEARYLAHCVMNITAMWSPDIVIFGGGVMQQDHLIERIRSEFSALSQDYWSLPPLADYIQKAELDQMAGIIGCLQIAQRVV